MLLPLINEFILEVTTVKETGVTLFVWLAQQPKYFIDLHRYVAEKSGTDSQYSGFCGRF